jgi:nucleotide-binding universal stress UspA family protein
MNNIFTKILVCIYGNNNDDAVLEGAINFGKAFNATLVIGATAEGARNSAEILDKELNGLSLTVERITLADDHIKTVAKMVDDIGADLVVAANQKHSQQLVDSIKVPVLSILNQFKKGQITNIIMPIHDDPGTRQKIPVATEIAKTFGANINILVVAGNSPDEITKLKTYAYQAEKYIHEKGARCSYQIETGKKVVTETIRVAEESNADILIIMNDRDGGGCFGKSKSDHIMAECSVPVLVVEPKDTTVSYAQL